jgi:hypothetical protein
MKEGRFVNKKGFGMIQAKQECTPRSPYWDISPTLSWGLSSLLRSLLMARS